MKGRKERRPAELKEEKGEKIKLKSREVGVIFATGLTEDRHQPASSGTSDNEKWEETFIPGGFSV